MNIAILGAGIGQVPLPQLLVKMNTASQDDIERFLHLRSRCFSPDFGSSIDIGEYAKKLRTYGNTYELWYEGELDALLVVYFSESLKQIYVPYICTEGSHYGPNVGQYLFQMITSFSVPFEYIRLEVREDNKKALDFYLKQGFTEISKEGKKIHLEKQLAKH